MPPTPWIPRRRREPPALAPPPERLRSGCDSDWRGRGGARPAVARGGARGPRGRAASSTSGADRQPSAYAVLAADLA